MTDPTATTDEDEPATDADDPCRIDTDDGLSDRWTTDVWAKGSYDAVAPTYFSMAGRLVDRLEVDADDRVLDVGCGTGTAAVTAARRGGDVTGVDIQPAMLDRARTHAVVAAVEIDWREGDATDLPFPANAFDLTLSNLGHMYGDPPDAAAHELVRVTRPGGRIGFTAWTPSSVYPAMAGALMSVVPPDALPEFTAPPFLWGDPDTVRDRLDAGIADRSFETGTVRAPALSPAHFVEETMDTSGLFLEILDAVDTADRPALRDQLIETVTPSFDERANAVDLEYLSVTATVETN